MKNLIFTCEHGGNEIPADFHSLFAGRKSTLNSHSGWDIGALDLAQKLHVHLNAPLYFSTTSRLLVELNRSLHHPQLFSAFTIQLSGEDKRTILAEYYFPYRTKVEKAIQNLTVQADTIHISVHSFTPVLNGRERKADIGLLYDPGRENEKAFCQAWKNELKRMDDSLNIRFNYPYRGTADGFTTYLRKKIRGNYTGIELEVNNRLLLDEGKNAAVVLADSLKNCLSKTGFNGSRKAK